MAMADYRRCDICGAKAFYDANMNYEEGVSGSFVPYRVAGKEQDEKPEWVAKYGARLGYVGDWAVICDSCSKTHKTMIVPIDSQHGAG